MSSYLLDDMKNKVFADSWKTSVFGSGSLFVGRDSILNFTDETSMTIEVHKPDLSDIYVIKTMHGIIIIDGFSKGNLSIKNETDENAKVILIRESDEITFTSYLIYSSETKVTSLSPYNTYSPILMFW